MSAFCKNTKTPGHVLENTILKTLKPRREAEDFLNAIRSRHRIWGDKSTLLATKLLNFRLRRACYKVNILCARRRRENLIILMVDAVFIVILCAAGAKILRFKGAETWFFVIF